MAEEDIRVGPRKIYVNQIPVEVYRASDGQDYASTRQAQWYMECTPYMAGEKIREWEHLGKIKRKKIKGWGLYTLLSDLDRIKEEIHSVKEP